MDLLEIDSPLVEEVLRHAERSLPEECCGVLVGRRDGESTRVQRVLASENAAPHPETQFEIPPELLLSVQRSARRESLEVVGYYHSHPRGSAAPSRTDRAEAWPGVSYLIVAPAGAPAVEVRSWRLGSEGDFVEEQIRASRKDRS
jgi:proteasome lid subunit RPN8/RPN11